MRGDSKEKGGWSGEEEYREERIGRRMGVGGGGGGGGGGRGGAATVEVDDAPEELDNGVIRVRVRVFGRSTR